MWTQHSVLPFKVLLGRIDALVKELTINHFLQVSNSTNLIDELKVYIKYIMSIIFCKKIKSFNTLLNKFNLMYNIRFKNIRIFVNFLIKYILPNKVTQYICKKINLHELPKINLFIIT